MKNSRFTDSQIMEALKRAEGGLAVEELCRDLAPASPDILQRLICVILPSPTRKLASGTCEAISILMPNADVIH